MDNKKVKKIKEKKYKCCKIGLRGEKCGYETNIYILHLLHKNTIHAW
ncbi:MAG: hypothetical protein K5986_08280 [Clostridium sp.]|nr:hypothetical protein [Clostridium sp. DSM 8431]MCR4944429.1 hypothetical protein [Clostridium sp.]SFU79329.1 hypothetical protein SAMN04487886_11664 [Clostridium sp. DSM 8431]